jgi:hypothetical protein
VADKVHSLFAGVPGVKKSVKWLLQSSGQAWRSLTTRGPTPRGALLNRGCDTVS